MQTLSHFLLTAVIHHKVAKPSAYSVHKTALLVGSVLPDIPFTVLTVVYEIVYRWFAAPPPAEGSIMEYLHFELFYTDPVWIIGHNFFHSLVINAALLGIGLWGLRRWRWAWPLLWLSVGMLFHTLIDIFTHHSDGPLLFFPLNWTYRFASPISYWEAAYYGRQFTAFEYLLDAAILVYFIWHWFTHRHTLVSEGTS